MINKYRILYIVSHPIQYQAPLLREISNEPNIELNVLFYWNTETSSNFDAGFGQKITWDIPLLDGYRSSFLMTLANSKKHIKKLKVLWDEISSQKFDYVWTHGYADLYTLTAICFAKLNRLNVFVRGESILFPDQQKSIALRWKRKLFFKFFDLFINRYLAIGTNNKNFYLSHGIPSKKIYLCPYTVDNNFFRKKHLAANNKIDQLKQLLGLDPNRPVILYASKFITRKYPIDLLKAYSQLISGNLFPKPYLLFIGTGETLASVKAASANAHLDAVKFLGFKNQSELPDFFALADIFVLPSIEENWGLVINEAMNARCAIIASDQVGCAIDLIQDGKNGFIYPARNIDALATALQKLIIDQQLCEDMKTQSENIISSWGLQESKNGLLDACRSSFFR